MDTEEICYIIIQVAIITLIGILFILNFNLFLDISIILLLVSLVIMGYIVRDELQKQELKKSIFKDKRITEFVAEVILFIIIMGIVQSMIYFYLNFDGGYFYSILLIFGIIAVIFTIGNNEILQEPKKAYLYIFNGFFVWYLTMYEYATIFDFTIIEINSLNPLSFITGLLFIIPYNFFLNIFMLFENKAIVETIIIHIGFLLFLILMNIFVVKKINSLLFQKNQETYSLVSKPGSISKIPLILFIIYLAFLQVGNGLSEFISTGMWLLAFMFIFYSIAQIQNNHMHDIFHLKITIILLLLVMSFIKHIYPLLANIPLIYSLHIINGTNNLNLEIIMFFVLNVLFFILIHCVLTSLHYTRQIEFVSYCYFLLVAFLIYYLPFILVKLLAISFLVFFFNLYENSINLKEIFLLNTKRQKFELFLQKITHLSIFFVAYLLM